MSLHQRVATVELVDGRVLTARVTLSHRLAFEKTAKARGWGDTEPITATTFVAWMATKDIHGFTFEDFRDNQVVDLTVEEGSEVDPTQPDQKPV